MFSLFEIGHITFQCPNKWTIFLREDIEIESGSKGQENTMTPLEDNNKVEYPMYSMIIDGGNCTNITSKSLVEKLSLPTLKHLRPYKLQWLNNCGEIKVTKQVKISFTIHKYWDEVNAYWTFTLGLSLVI